jgi:hypothetical protein
VGDEVSPIFKYRPEWQSGFKNGISLFTGDFGDRSYQGTVCPVFPDYGGLSLKCQTGGGKGRKTGLIIPYWEADRFSDGLEQVKEQETPVLTVGIFQGSARKAIINGIVQKRK